MVMIYVICTTSNPDVPARSRRSRRSRTAPAPFPPFLPRSPPFPPRSRPAPAVPVAFPPRSRCSRPDPAPCPLFLPRSRPIPAAIPTRYCRSPGGNEASGNTITSHDNENGATTRFGQSLLRRNTAGLIGPTTKLGRSSVASPQIVRFVCVR